MEIGRRRIIVGAAGLGIAGVVGEARAGVAPPQPREVGFLWALFMGIAAVWNSLPDNAKADLWEWGKEAIGVTGRTGSVGEDAGGPDGPTARIRVRIVKHANGHLLLNSHLANMSAGGAPHLTLSGSAAHHRHPSMRAHLFEVAQRSHTFLRTRNL
jgi:hypothetical protein